MDIYAIFLNEANAECWDKIREEWANGRHYILTDNLAFVASDGISTTVEVGKKSGLLETLRVHWALFLKLVLTTVLTKGIFGSGSAKCRFSHDPKRPRIFRLSGNTSTIIRWWQWKRQRYPSQSCRN